MTLVFENDVFTVLQEKDEELLITLKSNPTMTLGVFAYNGENTLAIHAWGCYYNPISFPTKGNGFVIKQC